jgi:hypothetical protein
VGGAAGDDLELARVAVLAERPQDVRGVAVGEHAADAVELPDIELRGVLEPVVLARGAVHLLFGERDQPPEVALVTLEQELVRHHGNERRRQRHREAVVHPVVEQPVQHVHERDVGLGQRLEEPVLLEELRIFGMADVRQMGVQHGAPVAHGHDGTSRVGGAPAEGGQRRLSA